MAEQAGQGRKIKLYGGVFLAVIVTLAALEWHRAKLNAPYEAERAAQRALQAQHEPTEPTVEDLLRPLMEEFGLGPYSVNQTILTIEVPLKVVVAIEDQPAAGKYMVRQMMDLFATASGQDIVRVILTLDGATVAEGTTDWMGKKHVEL